jgi:hypothetical protein
METVPAPPRDVGSSKWRVQSSPGQDRSSITAREGLPRPGQVPSLPGGVQSSVPRSTAPRMTAPGAPPSVTPGRGTTRSQVGTPGGSATGSGIKVSGSYAAHSLSGVHQQSALVRVLSPFIEDPRPRWLLALYFLAGVAIGVGAAFGLWGQH